jgi:serine/threonine-protein kinase RsbW
MVKNFPANLDELHNMLAFIREQALDLGFDEHLVSKIELACEEALVNIISYGYPANKGDIQVTCSLTESQGIQITIVDKGIPYNPLTNMRTVDIKAPLEKRAPGGFGIFFIMKLMDDVNYRRENNANILTLIKNRPPAS